MVGPAGFEPTASSPPVKRATRLRYGPTKIGNDDWGSACKRESSVNAFSLATRFYNLQFGSLGNPTGRKEFDPSNRGATLPY